MKRILTHSIALTLAAAAGHASAGVITGGAAFADFEDDTSGPFTLTFNERPGQGTNTAGAWSIAGGIATFANNSTFNDVATALVQPSAAGDFSLSVDVAVPDIGGNSFDFATPRVGLTALGTDPSVSNGNFNDSGIYAYVEANGATSTSYDFNIANDGAILATSAVFDITSFSATEADFSISLSGVFDSSGNLDLVATLTDNRAGSSLVIPDLTTTVLAADVPTGNNYGLRINNQSNNISVNIDNLSVVIPEPASLALLGLGGLALLGRSRRR
ncbi:MAG: PEP-CTERM sorting domain-containing protein [Planctomycetota bacterium]